MRFFVTFFGVLLPWPPRPFATSFPWHPFGLVSSVRSLGEEGSHDVPHGMHHHLTWKAELLLLLVLEDQKGQVGNCEVVMCFFLVMSDVKTQHPKQVQNLNLLRILKVVGALKRKRQKDGILCDFQSISISLTLPACWAMLGLALCCFPSQTETCNKKEIRIWFLGSSESFPTKFLWPKLDVKSFCFCFMLCDQTRVFRVFKLTRALNADLGQPDTQIRAKNGCLVQPKKLGSTQRGKFFVETYRTKLSKSMRFNEINDLFKKADAEGLGRACMSLKFAILNIRLLPSRVVSVLYLCFFCGVCQNWGELHQSQCKCLILAPKANLKVTGLSWIRFGTTPHPVTVTFFHF